MDLLYFTGALVLGTKRFWLGAAAAAALLALSVAGYLAFLFHVSVPVLGALWTSPGVLALPIVYLGIGVGLYMTVKGEPKDDPRGRREVGGLVMVPGIPLTACWLVAIVVALVNVSPAASSALAAL